MSLMIKKNQINYTGFVIIQQIVKHRFGLHEVPKKFILLMFNFKIT